MVKRPEGMNAFAFVAISRLRAVQLAQGCTPRVAGNHTVAVMAQLEVAAGVVAAVPDDTADGPAS